MLSHMQSHYVVMISGRIFEINNIQKKYTGCNGQKIKGKTILNAIQLNF